MSISHRTHRLRLVGSPAVEKLQSDRYRITFSLESTSPKEDWYSANKGRIFADYGSLQSTEFAENGCEPRTGEAYPDMRLTEAVSKGDASGGYSLTFVYETLGDTFVAIKDDDTDYEMNGLRRVTRTIIAKAGTDYTGVVGSSSISHQINDETAVTCYLGKFKISDTESSRTVEEVYLEHGILSETLDNVGSQKSKVIQSIGADPTTPDGYLLASKNESDFEGFQTNQFTFLKPSVLSRNVETRNNGKLRVETVEAFNETPTSTIGGVQISIRESDVEGIPTNQYVFALGLGEVERSSQTKNKGALIITTVVSLGFAGTATGIEIEATTREEDGYILFRNTFADGNGEVSRTTETRNQGKLIVTTVEALGSAGTGTGVEIEATTREQDGYTLFRNVFASGSGEVSRTVETKNKGALTITTVEALGSASTAAGIEIETTTREQDGYTLFRNVFADGNGEVSRTVETRNQGALTVTTVEALGSAGTGTGVEIEATTREQDGYTLFRNTFAEGDGEISSTVEIRNNGALTITTVEALGSAGSAIGVEIEATTREQDGYTLFRNVFADGQGEVSRTIEIRNQGKLTITTVEALGGAESATGVEIEATTREQDGYTLFRNVFANGTGEVSRSTETRNQGKLTITTIEALGAAGTATGVEIEATTREQDGYTLFRNTFADGSGEVSRTTETKNQGKLTITTVEALGSAGSATGVEIEATTRKQDGYTLFRNVFADGTGEVSRTVETRNQGKLTVTTVEALGSAGSATGVEIEATTREQDGYTLFRNTFADGSGEVSRTVDTRNQGKLTITTVEALGSAGSATGVEIEATTREQDGYTLFRNTFADGQGEVSRTTSTRNQGKLTITTVESLGSAGSAGGVGIEATTREQDGYTLFRNVFANGSGEVSRTVETKNKGALTITTIESLGNAGSAGGVEIEATTREQDGYTLFRNVYASGSGVISVKTDKQYQDTLRIVTTTAIGSASGIDNISSSSREQDGYTIFTNVGATGNGEISNSTEERNQGKVKINRIVSVGSPPSPTGTVIGRSEKKSDGHTVYDYTAAAGEGQIFTSTRPGPSQISGTQYVTVRSVGTRVDPPGVITATSETDSDGYKTFEVTSLQGNISGTKMTYKDVVDVEVPGTVNCTTESVTSGPVSGTIAVPLVTPRRRKRVAATVTVEVTTTPPDTAALAYDLGKISCSVTSTNAALARGVGNTVSAGTTAIVTRTGYSQDFNASARIQVFPGSYLTSASSTGSINYITSQEWEVSGNIITPNEYYSQRVTKCTGTGSTSADGYDENGIIKRDSRPILTSVDGTTYYEVITWST